jgi:putative glutamine amidotransferase
MSKPVPSLRIGVYGNEESQPSSRAFSLWAAGYSSSITAAEGIPVPLQMVNGCTWEEILQDLDGVVFADSKATNAREQDEEERLCETCRKMGIPLLGVDQGMHVLNTAFGGTVFMDVSREVPEALQHRQPPEPGARHAITVTEGTRLAQLYGEGEIVVNSEHRRAVNRLARGFRVCARALDGLIEAIEHEADSWFALGVQWHPAAVSASGLDIQVFRGLIEASARRTQRKSRPAPAHQAAQPVAA